MKAFLKFPMVLLTHITRSLLWFMALFMTKDGKKILLLGSLIGKLYPTVDDATLKRANDLLDICNDHNALRIPMKLESVLWNDVNMVNRTGLTEDEVMEERVRVMNQIKEAIPKPLSYGNESEITQALATLLTGENIQVGQRT